MSPKDSLIAFLVAFLWGSNFAVLKFSLIDLPPMFMAFLRFACVSIPAIFFVPRPRVPWKYFISFPMFFSVGQFSFLFFALAMGMSAGLSSLLMQSQIFFTLILSVYYFKERPLIHQLLGIAIAVVGLLFIGSSVQNTRMSTLGFCLTLLASACVACGNMVARKVAQLANVNIFHFVIWTNLLAIGPFFILSYCFDGLENMSKALHSLNLPVILAILYQAIFSTVIGFGLWAYLFRHNSPIKVVPYSLLIPIFGLLVAYISLGESLSGVQWTGACLLMLGLIVNTSFSFLFKKTTHH